MNDDCYCFSAEECAIVEYSAKRDCGYSGITADGCKEKGCCYDNSVYNAPHCFWPGKFVSNKLSYRSPTAQSESSFVIFIEKVLKVLSKLAVVLLVWMTLRLKCSFFFWFT